MSLHVKVSERFNTSFLDFCSRHHMLPFEAMKLIEPIIKDPLKGTPVVQTLVSGLMVLELCSDSSRSDFLIYAFDEASKMVVLVEITDFDLEIVRLSLMNDPVQQFRLIRAFFRLIEIFLNIFS